MTGVIPLFDLSYKSGISRFQRVGLNRRQKLCEGGARSPGKPGAVGLMQTYGLWIPRLTKQILRIAKRNSKADRIYFYGKVVCQRIKKWLRFEDW